MYSLSASRSGTPTQVLGGNQTSALLHAQQHTQPARRECHGGASSRGAWLAMASLH